MAERKKGPREVRKLPFELAALISPDATLSSVSGYASRKITLTTTLASTIDPEDTTIDLNANPVVGALVVVNPGSVGNEETFKITSVSGSSPPFTCGITPTAEMAHASGEQVDYEPGVSTPFLVDDTPTPVGSLATFVLQQGADAQTYRVSAVGTCDNGEVIEDETDIDVVEFAPITSVIKQPGETRDIAVDFSAWTAAFETTLSSAVGFAARTTSVNTTLAALASAGATSLSLTAHPGVGALLTVNPGGPTQEKLWVSAVSGGGPYTATISPLQFDHSNGETVTYHPGVSTRLLVSTSATISGTEAIFRVRRGAAERSYHTMVLATLADGQIVQQAFTLETPEL